MPERKWLGQAALFAVGVCGGGLWGRASRFWTEPDSSIANTSTCSESKEELLTRFSLLADRLDDLVQTSSRLDAAKSELLRVDRARLDAASDTDATNPIPRIEETLRRMHELLAVLAPTAVALENPKPKMLQELQTFLRDNGTDPYKLHWAEFCAPPFVIYSRFGKPDRVTTSGLETQWDYRIDKETRFRVRFLDGVVTAVQKLPEPEED